MMPTALINEGPWLVYEWGDLEDQETLARRLFAGLRELDAAGATVIVCPMPGDHGLGVTIRDRLLKAAR
jgi:L-threonylcarbamoyladenylate synthase